MLVYANSYLKCGIFGVSHFHKKDCHFSIRRTWSLNCLPARVDALHLTRRIGVVYTVMSSKVMEKMGNNVVVKEDLQDFDVPYSYETAMEALSSLITRKKRGDKSFVGGTYGKLERMSEYLKILGLEEHMDGLKIIHVAGTKGKGSTCTFCEAVLRECGLQTGLFTSPHLIDVRERFRINGLDISEDKFLQYFWDCWNQLKVDVAIIEVGLGGTKDSTNVIEKPVVCGITSLGMDHTETLGNTLALIASHKAGIFKPQIPAFTVPQLSEAMDVILQRAHELKVPLKVATPLDNEQLNGLKLSLSGDHQFINAGLAVSLCKCWLQRTGNWEKLFQNDIQEANLPEAFLRGLSTAHISGRAQIVYDTCSQSYNSLKVSENPCGDLVFYLDGAHSPESMEACAKWFSSAVKGNMKSLSTSFNVECLEEVWGNGHIQHARKSMESDKLLKQILLFNCMDVRDPQILLPRLVSTCASSGTHFAKALFVPSMSTYNKVTSGASVIPSDIFNRDLSWQFNLQRLWEKIIHVKEVDTSLDMGAKMDNAKILPPHEFLYEDASHCNPADNNFSCSAVMPSLPLTIKWLRDCVKENPSVRVQVLVTGSLHLVGDVLKLLKR
ncbi:folylpolyglutamate synthase isoform X3 [Corylus avellana]|uniref:folylpolyglutamate synthase isoform X3 n=1 Tax=Corylus avellana TaxID=13451 RepID=UPI002869FFDA|nr:folylpolyglutamate synthase isoform X3 [Corylus avellana]